jgi:cysteine desulfurase
VQTVGKLPVKVSDLKCDLVSVSAHKFHGPKGVGVLYIRKGVKIEPFMHGGGQENNRRAGTHNVPGIVGMGKAAELAGATMRAEADRVRALRDRLEKGILERIPDVRVNGHPTQRLPGILNICVDGVEGEAMLLCLDMNRICVSSGSACTTGSLEPSHVLLAMGIPPERAHGSVRFALGRSNTEEQIAYVVDTFAGIVARLRQMSPTYKSK